MTRPPESFIVAKALYYRSGSYGAPGVRFEDQPEYIRERYLAEAVEVIEWLRRADYEIIDTGMGK